jgi:DNA adenine methylase
MGNNISPLRYPGGKRKLAPFIFEILDKNNLIGGQYAEPYAGGAGVAIELLLNDHVTRIHLNDSSLAVYSFWHSILHETEEFCSRILRASLNVKEWKRQREIIRNPDDTDKLDLGFAMFYLNRCNRSGILSGGLIGGLKQTGEWKMNARFSRVELIQRIEAIAHKKRFIRIRNWDAERFVLEYLPRLPSKTLVYFDPPYFNKAESLYHDHYSEQDHKDIGKIIQTKVKKPWIVSYDNNPAILKIYDKRKKFTYDIQYNLANVYQGREVIIFSDKLKLPATSSVSFINRTLHSVH